MTENRLKSGVRSPKNSAGIQELPNKQKALNKITDHSTNDPLNLSGSNFFTDMGSINLTTQLKTI